MCPAEAIRPTGGRIRAAGAGPNRKVLNGPNRPLSGPPGTPIGRPDSEKIRPLNELPRPGGRPDARPRPPP
nr:MAG: hypothetical protein DIU54_11065 [Acidobacteriota bacterium]